MEKVQLYMRMEIIIKERFLLIGDNGMFKEFEDECKKSQNSKKKNQISLTVLYVKVKFLMGKDMVKESILGRMVQNKKDNLKMINLMIKMRVSYRFYNKKQDRELYQYLDPQNQYKEKLKISDSHQANFKNS